MKKKPYQFLDETAEQNLSITLDKNVAKPKIKNWKSAEDVVIEYEIQKGWRAEKVSNCGYDIKSTRAGEERHIEVKSKDGKGKIFGWTELSANETKQFWLDPDYWVYLVEGNSADLNAPIEIVELDWAQLKQIAKQLEVVRFLKLGKLTRTSFDRRLK